MMEDDLAIEGIRSKLLAHVVFDNGPTLEDLGRLLGIVREISPSYGLMVVCRITHEAFSY
jgi:hypothetical protein